METPPKIYVDKLPPDPHRVDRLQCLIICVDYNDFLKETLKHNLVHFNSQDIVVVTSTKDVKTQRTCQFYSVPFLATDIFYENSQHFAKANAINYGLHHFANEGWRLIMDADVLLPKTFRKQLENAQLQKDCLYGADRFHVTGWNNYQELLQSEHWKSEWKYGCQLNVWEHSPMGGRHIDGDYGYCPAGYFQLWHTSAKRRYPCCHGDGSTDDILFSAQWPVTKRLILPSVAVYHLESEDVVAGTNWWGRKTKPFCAPEDLPPEPVKITLEVVAQSAYEAVRAYHNSLLGPEIKNTSQGTKFNVVMKPWVMKPWAEVDPTTHGDYLLKTKMRLQNPNAPVSDPKAGPTEAMEQSIFSFVVMSFIQSQTQQS